MILTFQVEDARRELEALRAKGIEPDVDIKDEPWGQRHFMMRDPAGVWVDIVEQIDPTGVLRRRRRDQPRRSATRQGYP